MEFLGILFIFGVVISIFLYIKMKVNIFLFKIRKNKYESEDKFVGIYSRKKFMTDYERYFYNIFVELENEFNVKVIPQVNLAAIIKKEINNYYINELFRNVDFAIFDKDYNNVLLLIEINDSTHKTSTRIARDIKVEKILKDADIKLMKFYSNYPNKKDYVKERVKQVIIELLKSN